MILLRHGESVWNKENRFTGWTDVDLSSKGIEEVKKAAELLKNDGITFDVAFTSVLKRGIRTLWIVLDEMDMMWIPVYRSWRLNERHYGALQGLNKAEVAAKYGEEQVHLWRRSYDIDPPGGESLKGTAERTIPYFKEYILKELQEGKKVLVVAHGNSLRSITMYVEDISEQEIPNVEIPTGIPIVYVYDLMMKTKKKEFL